MYQRDYLLRMIEMIGDLVAAIFGFLRKKEFKKALEIIDNAYQEFLKQDAAFFLSIPKENLTSELISKHNYTNGHLEILAELFYAEAEVLFAQSKIISALPYYEKSLNLTEFILNDSKTFSMHKQERIAFLKSRISEISKNSPNTH